MSNLLSFDNTACVGCGQILAARTVVNALGPDVIIANATGCLEITTSRHGHSAWGVPWIHSLFANPASVASGIYAALKQQGLDKKTKILVQAGDGSTFDIGFGAVSGLWSRGEPIIYICYDNEIYANTGMQASAATIKGTNTATTPAVALELGFTGHKKDMMAIALAHGVPYVAQTTSAFLDDLKAKVLAAAATDGPSYIQVLSSCIPGWHIDVKDTMLVPKLAAETGIYPLLEFRYGQKTSDWKVPRPIPLVKEYLAKQRRFAHLVNSPEGLELIDWLQNKADENIAKYDL
ncbi:MAG: thiamine pyrophosphate-dependent enzyme [Candidatus Falkowbacteria bacterium]